MSSAFWRRICFAPGVQVDCARDDAKYIGWDESKLCSSKADDAHDDAINCRQDPAFPTTASDQNRGSNGQYTRKIIKTKHE